MTSAQMNSIKYHHTDADDNELTLLVEFAYQPGDPGRLNDLPENCYPPTDPEIEITSIRLADASTPQSRTHPRFRRQFGPTTPGTPIFHALEQLGVTDPYDFSIEVPTEQLSTTLNALNQGGFIGPEQRLVRVEVSDLLSEETLNNIEAKCWESAGTGEQCNAQR